MNEILLEDTIKLLDYYFNRDEKYPDLWELINSSSYSFEYHPIGFLSQFYYKKKHIILPDILLDQYKNVQSKSFMGVFPNINRAWITIDNKLFIWNYQQNGDFCVYDGLEQIIISVSLVIPKMNIFIESVKYLLVIATPVEIVILAISFVGDSIDGDIILTPTGLSSTTDDINFIKIIGLEQNGRIFMCGSDGNIYELTYETTFSWNFFLGSSSRKCRKINRSSPSSIFWKIIPSFLKFSEEDPIIDIVIDSTRNILYTLSDKKNCIQVFDLGINGDSMIHICSKYDIIQQTEKLYSKATNFKIISLFVIPIYESYYVHLVAITNTGLRLYFSTYSNPPSLYGISYSSSNIQRPSTLELVHVRLLPPTSFTQSSILSGLTHQHILINSCYYSRNSFLISYPRDNDGDNLIATNPDKAENIHILKLLENVTTIPIEGRIWTIDEWDPLNWNLFWFQRFCRNNPRLGSNELATQHIVPSRKFLCLSNNGIHIIEKMKPVDQLQQLLLQTGGRETEEIKNFFKKYGEEEACAMCLILACSSNILQNQYPFFPTIQDPNVLDWITNIFFKLGGRPQIIPSLSNLPYNQYNNQYNISKMETNISYSYSHNGFAIYLSRLLRPLWNEYIIKTIINSSNNNSQTEYICNFTIDELFQVESFLTNLKGFLNKNPQFSSLPGSLIPLTFDPNISNDGILTISKKKTDEEARKLEYKSLSNLHWILVRSIEACIFLIILNENNFSQLISSLTNDMKNKLLNITFRKLVTTSEGQEIAKELTNALINFYTKINSSVDTISSILQEKCPSFFNESDRMRFKANELLEKAKKITDFQERNIYLDQSLEIFRKIPQQISLDSICEKYKFLYYYHGIVELALLKASILDPKGLALVWNNLNRPPSDNEGKQAFEQRLQCYRYIIDALDELSIGPQLEPGRPPIPAELENLKIQTLQKAIESNDELFHYTLYQWYIDHHLENELLLIESPIFLENFLKNVIVNLDLLWQFYLRNNNYAAAANILSMLAEKKENEVNLHQRIEYLSRAKSCLSKIVGINGDTLRELQEKMEMATVQLKIFYELNQLQTEKQILKEEIDKKLKMISEKKLTEESEKKLKEESEKKLKELQEIINAKKELNLQLLNASDLYNKYAQKFHLYECQLAIIRCSDYDDIVLVKKLWNKIIIKEFKENKIIPLKKKILSLGKEYYPSELVFPLNYLIDFLEKKSFENRSASDWSQDWVIDVFHEIGISYAQLFDIYNYCFNSKDSYWQVRETKIHLLESIYQLIVKWKEFIDSSQATLYDKKLFESKHIDICLEKILSTNYFDKEEIEKFKLQFSNILYNKYK